MSKQQLDAIEDAIVSAADANFSEFNSKIKDVLTDKLEQMTKIIVDQKAQTIFQK